MAAPAVEPSPEYVEQLDRGADPVAEHSPVPQPTRQSFGPLRAAWRAENILPRGWVLAGALIPLALWLGVTPMESALLIGSVLLVLVVGLMNAGLEAVVAGLVSERHEALEQARDLGSAAVFISLLLAALLWVAISWQRFGG